MQQRETLQSIVLFVSIAQLPNSSDACGFLSSIT